MKNKHSGMESRTQCDGNVVTSKRKRQDGVAGGNTRREEDSQPDGQSQAKASVRLIPTVLEEETEQQQGDPFKSQWQRCVQDGISRNQEGIRRTTDA